MTRFTAAVLRCAVAATMALLAMTVTPALGLNGLSPLQLTPLAGWRATELLSQGNNLTGLADAGYGATATRGLYDGLGVSRNGPTMTVWINHETSPAAISRLELDRSLVRLMVEDLRSGGSGAVAGAVTAAGFAYERIYDTTYHASSQPFPSAEGAAAVAAYGSANFARFCSGTAHAPSAFGAGRGFANELYLTGEEVTGGRFYALDVSTRSLWEATDLGVGLWENATAIDTGDADHVALLLSSDNGTAPGDYLRLYLGRKGIDANGDGAIDFLERNGLRGGTIRYFQPSSGSTTDLPDGTVAGFWRTSGAGALRETKLEDVHTNPRNGSQVVLGSQLDGVYRLEVPLTLTAGGDLDEALSPVTIVQVHDDDVAPIGAPDNVTWSYDGRLYVQEDGDGNGMFRMAASGGSIEHFATGLSEPSGIIDASVELGYQPGSVLLTSLMGTGAVGGQLAMLVAPNAAPLVTGDYNLDGEVALDDEALWRSRHGVVGFSTADGNADGRVDAADYTVWRDAFGAAAAAAVPEPTAVATAAVAIALAARRRV